ncbi:hypothetical protein DFH08DRAFT_825527 [Mycena albidolilacea]|uniref:Uncharacterized protein n=1 Tax=Mycena albidolilacea TaxID=1033008 RepID=A0AAD7E966_9AGAR|nr:hypothetical protein DFH08DRAFT_825527 [Mycena albidolilacea]
MHSPIGTPEQVAEGGRESLGVGAVVDRHGLPQESTATNVIPNGSINPTVSNSNPLPTQSSSNSAGDTANTVPRKCVPVATMVGSTVGYILVLLLCVAVLFIWQQCSTRQSPALLGLVQKVVSLGKKQPKRGPSSSEISGSTSNLPTAAEIALANMAEEVRMLWGQFQQLEFERQLSRSGGTTEE